jgi:hypothetical protein
MASRPISTTNEYWDHVPPSKKSAPQTPASAAGAATIPVRRLSTNEQKLFAFLYEAGERKIRHTIVQLMQCAQVTTKGSHLKLPATAEELQFARDEAPKFNVILNF